MSMSEQEIFQAILSRARTELNPKIRVVPKREVWIHSVINKIMNIVYPASNKDRYLAFNTTLGNTIAMNAEAGNTANDFGNWDILCHEIKHTLQAKKWTRGLFSFLYMFPISFAVLLILTAWTPVLWVHGWKLALWITPWVGLGALLLHPKWPDPWRTRWELQAYTISMYLYHRINRDIPVEYINFQLEQFTSINYFIMEPNKDKMLRILNENARLIKEGKHPVKDEAIVKIAEEVLAKAG